RKATISSNLAEAVPQILCELVDQEAPAHSCLLMLVLSAAVLPRVLQITELPKRLTARRVRGCPLRNEIFHAHLKVNAKLLVNVCLMRIALTAQIPERTLAAAAGGSRHAPRLPRARPRPRASIAASSPRPRAAASARRRSARRTVRADCCLKVPIRP